MQSSTVFGHLSQALPIDVRGYDISLDLRDGQARLALGGDLDASATDALRGILTCIGSLPGELHVDAAEVVGCDLDAFDPLLATARLRRLRGGAHVVLDSLSDAVRDLFGVLRIPTDPPIELAAGWT